MLWVYYQLPYVLTPFEMLFYIANGTAHKRKVLQLLPVKSLDFACLGRITSHFCSEHPPPQSAIAGSETQDSDLIWKIAYRII